MSAQEAFEKFQRGFPEPLDRGYKHAFKEGHASCDAEVAELKAKLTEAECKLSMALEAMNEALGAVTYAHQQDECGAFVCCQKVSYEPHADDCYLNSAIKELESKP